MADCFEPFLTSDVVAGEEILKVEIIAGGFEDV